MLIDILLLPYIQVGKGEIFSYVCILFDSRKISCAVKNSEGVKIEELFLFLEMMS